MISTSQSYKYCGNKYSDTRALHIHDTVHAKVKPARTERVRRAGAGNGDTPTIYIYAPAPALAILCRVITAGPGGLQAGLAMDQGRAPEDELAYRDKVSTSYASTGGSFADSAGTGLSFAAAWSSFAGGCAASSSAPVAVSAGAEGG